MKLKVYENFIKLLAPKYEEFLELVLESEKLALSQKMSFCIQLSVHTEPLFTTATITRTATDEPCNFTPPFTASLFVLSSSFRGLVKSGASVVSPEDEGAPVVLLVVLKVIPEVSSIQGR